MKVVCAQGLLAEALATVGRIVPAKTTLPVLGNILLDADPADGLRLVATNLDLTVTQRVRAEVTTAGRTTVPGKLLADYVALLDRGKQVSLSLAAHATRLHLACERCAAQIATLPPDDFPPAPVVDVGAVHLELDGAVLRQAIEHVVFAAAPDDVRPVLAGVLLRLDAGTLTLAAADGYRMAIRTIDLADTTTNATWLVPARALRELARSLPTARGLPVTLRGTTSTPQLLHVVLPGFELTSRLVEGQFPDFERIIPQASATTVIVGTADLLRATRAASVFARDNAHIVRLVCSPPPDDGTPALGRVLVTAASAEMGDNAGHLEASVQGEAGEIALNGVYLRDALEALSSPQVGLQFSGGQHAGALRPIGELETAYLQLIMPMRGH